VPDSQKHWLHGVEKRVEKWKYVAFHSFWVLEQSAFEFYRVVRIEQPLDKSRKPGCGSIVSFKFFVHSIRPGTFAREGKIDKDP